MKKISLALALAAMLAFAFVGTASARVVKASGGVKFDTGSWNFNVHSRINAGQGAAWGQVLIKDTPTGTWWRAKVKYVNLDVGPNTVLFAAEIVATNNTTFANAYVGDGVLMKVYDGGSPGRDHDLLWGGFYSPYEDAEDDCKDPAALPEPSELVLSGNLVVY